MARFSHHEQCPKCAENGRDRKKNNLGVYEDGSSYCYSCGYSKSSLGSNALRWSSSKQPTLVASNVVLPEDVESYFPTACIEWINQYELTKNDLYANKCLWSNKLQRLIFPIYSEPNRSLLAWQGRYFGTREDSPKWISYGKLDTIFHIFNRERSRSSLVLVEDIVSAYKVSKVRVGHSENDSGRSGACAVMPLFGSYISPKKLAALKLLTDKLILWLDPDKYKESVKFCKEAQILGLPCTVVNSDKDPKEISYESIDKLLKGVYTI